MTMRDGAPKRESLSVTRIPIWVRSLWVKIDACLRGLQIATYRSIAMATNMPDSIHWNVWISHICKRQVSKYMLGRWNQNIPSILGKMEVLRAMSVAPSIAKKSYIGSWRIRSTLMTTRSREFPKRAMMYMIQKGIPIQNCTVSKPGIPVRISTEGLKKVLLRCGMLP